MVKRLFSNQINQYSVKKKSPTIMRRKMSWILDKFHFVILYRNQIHWSDDNWVILNKLNHSYSYLVIWNILPHVNPLRLLVIVCFGFILISKIVLKKLSIITIIKLDQLLDHCKHFQVIRSYFHPYNFTI